MTKESSGKKQQTNEHLERGIPLILAQHLVCVLSVSLKRTGRGHMNLGWKDISEGKS